MPLLSDVNSKIVSLVNTLSLLEANSIIDYQRICDAGIAVENGIEEQRAKLRVF
jgi:hypothetical protein